MTHVRLSSSIRKSPASQSVIYSVWSRKSTDDLLQTWLSDQRDTLQESVIQAVRKILAERGVQVPDVNTEEADRVLAGIKQRAEANMRRKLGYKLRGRVVGFYVILGALAHVLGAIGAGMYLESTFPIFVHRLALLTVIGLGIFHYNHISKTYGLWKGTNSDPHSNPLEGKSAGITKGA